MLNDLAVEERILLAHGSGGKKMHSLLNEVIFPATDSFNNHDSAVLDILSNKIAMTTDSFVVDPIFFRGGDIGCLSVYGTINDLAMSGAIPKFLSLALILEEGLQVSYLKKILLSINSAAKKVNVKIITGDTKVVDKGHGHGIYTKATLDLGAIKR